MEHLKQQGTSGALAAPPSADIGDMTKDEMAQRIIAYQRFMAKYIVEAQQQKGNAVLAAEAALKQKYEEKVLLLSGSTAQTAKPAKIEASPETKLYKERSEKVSAAAKAGKSRWGDMENKRAAEAAGASVSPPETISAAPPEAIQVNGAVAPAGTDRRLYDQRTAHVAAAAKAGKSRWGEMEVQRAVSVAAALPASTPATVKAVASPKPTITVPPPEVTAADHGLRNDGGVGGPSLAERINLGAQILGGPSVPAAAAPDTASTTATSLFDKRNLMIAAAGKAGKSRWGEKEVEKAQSAVAALPSAAASTPASSTPAPVVVPAEVAEADHGLRNDGGVGGPSLAERINLGAALMGQ